MITHQVPMKPDGNESTVEMLGDETLRQIDLGVDETVWRNATVDSTPRWNLPARLRVAVKRGPQKCGNRPEKQ